MVRNRRSLFTLHAIAACFTLVGCGEPKPSVSTSRQEVTVSGTVKVYGDLATSGEISFDPSNYLRNEAPRTALIDKEGRYTITTLVGPNSVRVQNLRPTSVPNDDGTRAEAPERREDVGYLEVQVELRAGQTTQDIELPAATESTRP